jgi:Ser/Thr protein kinase RdoA (MazF antagonist)
MKKDTLLQEIATYFNLGTLIEQSHNQKGIVNLTYEVITEKGKYIIQKLSNIFDERVVEDHIEVEKYLRFKNFIAPQLIPTPSGSWSYRRQGSLWKVSKYIDHDVIARSNKKAIKSAATTLGRFHAVMEDCVYLPRYSIPDFHNTAKIIAKLKRLYEDNKRLFRAQEYAELYEYICKKIGAHMLPITLKKTLIHGDPKFDNFLFKDNTAIALIDFDTVMIAPAIIDIGDALRSWCRYDRVKFDEDLFNAAIEGYNTSARSPVTHKEGRNAVALISLELAARFLIDCFEESYFEWDKKRFKKLADHNKERAEEMIEYHKNITK